MKVHCCVLASVSGKKNLLTPLTFLDRYTTNYRGERKGMINNQKLHRGFLKRC
jgi:hypothetical protein